MATINHYDEHTGRYLQLSIDDSEIDKARHHAQDQERSSLRRVQVIRRCLRLLDSGVAKPEFVIGEAFNAGHTIGSGVADFTALEQNLLMLITETPWERFEACNWPTELLPILEGIRLMKEKAAYEH